MRFQITYATGYDYSAPVRDNLNVLRVKPATTAHQSVTTSASASIPESRLHQYRDYFGSEVIEFGVTEPHERLGDGGADAGDDDRAGGRSRAVPGS